MHLMMFVMRLDVDVCGLVQVDKVNPSPPSLVEVECAITAAPCSVVRNERALCCCGVFLLARCMYISNQLVRLLHTSSSASIESYRAHNLVQVTHHCMHWVAHSDVAAREKRRYPTTCAESNGGVPSPRAAEDVSRR